MIDFHVHIGRLHLERPPLTVAGLLRFMGENGIEKAPSAALVDPLPLKEGRGAERPASETSG